MRDDELLPRYGRWAVRLERRLPHPVDKVWRAVTEPDHLAQWFPARVAGDLQEGGTITFAMDADAEPEPGGEVLRLDPPHLFAFTWGEDELRLELSPDGDGTLLVLVHTFHDKPGAASFGAGWDQCLVALAAILAGAPVPAPDRAVARHEELAARFGLDQPTVTEADGRWTLRFERQLTCPAEAAWDLFLGRDAETEEPRPALAVGQPLTAGARNGVQGTVTEIDPPRVLAFDTATDEPGDEVRFELVEGTGHGARLVLTITGSAERPVERDAAIEQWGAGAVERIAAQAAALG